MLTSYQMRPVRVGVDNDNADYDVASVVDEDRIFGVRAPQSCLKREVVEAERSGVSDPVATREGPLSCLLLLFCSGWPWLGLPGT